MLSILNKTCNVFEKNRNSSFAWYIKKVLISFPILFRFLSLSHYLTPLPSLFPFCHSSSRLLSPLASYSLFQNFLLFTSLSLTHSLSLSLSYFFFSLSLTNSLSLSLTHSLSLSYFFLSLSLTNSLSFSLTHSSLASYSLSLLIFYFLPLSLSHSRHSLSHSLTNSLSLSLSVCVCFQIFLPSFDWISNNEVEEEEEWEKDICP